MNTTRRAHAHAGRLFIFGQPVNAEIALYGYFALVFELHGSERTSLYTFPASDAQAGINQYDALIVP
jgi:hypothetical protein